MSLPTHTLLDRAPAPARRIATYKLHVAPPDALPAVVHVTAPCFRVGSRPGADLVLADPMVSRLHFEIVVDADGHRLRDLESRNGTFVDDYRTADIYLRSGSRIRVGRTELVFELLATDALVPASSSDRFGPVLGRSLAMRELFALLERAAASDATVLIEGETGTGKELVAQAIHEASPRAGGPFAVFDCASVPPTLIESELFGHERGAFTGAASRRIGRMEEAASGTLFIDELGELPLELQPRLLRALESREVRRLGGSKPIAVDVRIVAATNRDLAREVNRGTFREDLYYRLAVVRVHNPALRERLEDLPLLVEHFVRRACGPDSGRAARLFATLGEATWQKLASHPWPGNVRELRNVIERTVALAAPDGGIALDLDAPPRELPAPALPGSHASPVADSRFDVPYDLTRPFMEQKADVVARFEKTYLEAQLARHGGNITRAAAASGLDRMYFKKLLKK